MRSGVLVVLALIGSCACAYHAPTGPDAVPASTPSNAAASIRLTAATRTDRRLDVVATVLTVDGRFVPDVNVTFSASAGTLAPTSATTDASGAARTILTTTTTQTVQVIAIAGALQSALTLFVIAAR